MSEFPRRVLLVDDDAQLGEPLAAYLARYQIALTQELRPTRALELVRNDPQRFEAMILDVMMPQMDGFEVIRELRGFSELPILMLTARGELSDRVVGLELGADDYLPKPFEPRELAARLQAILRRRVRAQAGKHTADTMTFEGLTIDSRTRGVWVEEQAVELTSNEFDLLQLMARDPGKVFSRDDLLNHLKGQEVDLFTRAIDIMVSRLRKKLEPLDAIKTMRNQGYCLALAKKV